MHSPRSLKTMWDILDMPAPTAVAASSLDLGSRVQAWPRTLYRDGTRYAFQKLVGDYAAYYISPASHYLLVVAD